MEQISDFIKQLYEYFFLKKNEIKKLQKNISSDLLASFGRQLTREDISQDDMHSISATWIKYNKGCGRWEDKKQKNIHKNLIREKPDLCGVDKKAENKQDREKMWIIWFFIKNIEIRFEGITLPFGFGFEHIFLTRV